MQSFHFDPQPFHIVGCHSIELFWVVGTRGCRATAVRHTEKFSLSVSGDLLRVTIDKDGCLFLRATTSDTALAAAQTLWLQHSLAEPVEAALELRRAPTCCRSHCLCISVFLPSGLECVVHAQGSDIPFYDAVYTLRSASLIQVCVLLA